MKKGLLKSITLLTAIPLVINITGVSAFIGEDMGMNFFKTLDKGTMEIHNKMIENELKGSGKKIADYVDAKLKYKFSSSPLDPDKDWTVGELEAVKEDGNVAHIFNHTKEMFQNGDLKLVYYDIEEIRGLIIEWYESKESEMYSKERSLQTISTIGLYNDGSIENSSFDIMEDMKKINGVIFSQENPYPGVGNGTSLEFGDLQEGKYNNVPSTFYPSNTNNGTNTYQAVLGTALSPANSTSNASDPLKTAASLQNNISKSNLCNTGTDASISGDLSLMQDLLNQLNTGESSQSTSGGKSGRTGGSGNRTGNGNTNPNPNVQGGSGDGDGGGLFDSFPCNSFFCIDISMKVYSQNLLSGGKSESIEGLLDKNFKIINTYAGKSMIQSDMTKNFFSLSILRKLNLPSMVYLGIVISKLPPPILNLQTKKTSNEFEDESILERTFDQIGLDYKTQNKIDIDQINTSLGNCEGLDLNRCFEKIESTRNAYTPEISNTNIMQAKIGEKYKRSLDDDISELIGFSNTFKTNISQITGTIIHMSKKKQ